MLKSFTSRIVSSVVRHNVVKISTDVDINSIKYTDSKTHYVSKIQDNFPDEDGTVTDNMGNRYNIEIHMTSEDPCEEIMEIRYVPDPNPERH